LNCEFSAETNKFAFVAAEALFPNGIKKTDIRITIGKIESSLTNPTQNCSRGI